MKKEQRLAYFGHHKCGTTWIHGILSDVCGKLALKIAYVHSPWQFAGKLEEFVRQNELDFLTYTNADIDHACALHPLRGFHVIRDPRDVIVSSYFSHLHSHPVDDWAALSRHREALQRLTKPEGLLLDMEFMEPQLRLMERWNYRLPGVLEVKMEELIGGGPGPFARVFSHLGLLAGPDASAPPKDGTITREELEAILEGKRFSALAAGRKPGQEDVHSHFRKGIVGDWLNHFDGTVKDRFKKKFNPMLVQLGYEKDENW